MVESSEKSEEVLRDFRQTISECIADNYFGTFRQLAADEGLELTAQAIGNALCITADAIAVKKNVDKPQGEFWTYQQTGAYDVKDCSSAAHLYGKKIASAEAFTDALYSDTPLRLARVANIAFSFGAQEFAICATPHIPLAEPDGPYVAGREYAINRSNPLWDEMKPLWMACARSAYVLRQGRAAPDVLVYIGDDVPVKTLTGRLPAGLDGLDWDVCTGDALRTRLSVTADGMLSTPDSVVYKAIIIGDDACISAASRRVLEDFRSAGALILRDASPVERPIEISGEEAGGGVPFVRTRRIIGGRYVHFLANVSDSGQSLRFRIPGGSSRMRIYRTADGSSRVLHQRRDSVFTIRLEAGESVFVRE